MKVFVSIPMAGVDDGVIVERIRSILDELTEKYGKQAECINYIDDDTPRTPIEFMAESIKAMCQADLVYFAKGWATARGCRIEHMVARSYLDPEIILYEEDYDKLPQSADYPEMVPTKVATGTTGDFMWAPHCQTTI